MGILSFLSGGGNVDQKVEKAIQSGDIEKVKSHIQKGYTINQYEISVCAPLVTAVETRNYEMVSFLLQAGAAVNLPGTLNRSPLLVAANRSEPRIVKALIDAGAELDYVMSDDEYQDNALFEALRTSESVFTGGGTDFPCTKEDCVQTIAHLIRAGIDLDHKNNEDKTWLEFGRDLYKTPSFVTCLVAKLLDTPPCYPAINSFFPSDDPKVFVAYDEEAGTTKLHDGEGYILNEGPYADYSTMRDRIEEKALFWSNGLAPFPYRKGSWGYVNRRGNWVIEPKYLYAAPFAENGLAFVRGSEGNVYINRLGQAKIHGSFDWGYPFYGNVAVVRVPKYGHAIIDERGTILRQGEDITNFSRGEGFSYENGYGLGANILSKRKMIDNSGKEIGPEEQARLWFSHHPSAKVAPVLQNDRFGYMNANFEWVIEPTLDRVQGEFADGLSFFALGEHEDDSDNLKGYISMSGNVVIEPQYVKARAFSIGLAAVSEDGETWGYINTDGEMMIEAQFDYAESFKGSYAVVGFQIDGRLKKTFINDKGKVVSEDRWDDVVVYQ